MTNSDDRSKSKPTTKLSDKLISDSKSSSQSSLTACMVSKQQTSNTLTLRVATPAVNHTVSSQRANVAVAKRNQETSLLEDISGSIDILKNNCFACFAFWSNLPSKTAKHTGKLVEVCPKLREYQNKACYNCFNRYHSKEFTCHLVRNSAVYCSRVEVCYKCLLPNKVGSVTFHAKNQFGSACPRGDINILQFVFYCFRTNSSSVSYIKTYYPDMPKPTFQSDKDVLTFHKWGATIDPSSGLMNIVMVAHKLVEACRSKGSLTRVKNTDTYLQFSHKHAKV